MDRNQFPSRMSRYTYAQTHTLSFWRFVCYFNIKATLLFIHSSVSGFKNMFDPQDEIFDMVKPKDPYKITLQDLVNSCQGDTVTSILIDLNGFWTYENREVLVTNDNDGIGPADLVDTWKWRLSKKSTFGSFLFKYVVWKLNTRYDTMYKYDFLVNSTCFQVCGICKYFTSNI